MPFFTRITIKLQHNPCIFQILCYKYLFPAAYIFAQNSLVERYVNVDSYGNYDLVVKMHLVAQLVKVHSLCSLHLSTPF